VCLGTKGGVGGTAAVRLSADGEGGCWGGWLNWSQVWKPISGIISDEACCAHPSEVHFVIIQCPPLP
jgi:hypothetical protein